MANRWCEWCEPKTDTPGDVFHYRFTPHQSGTYWYHAHDGFQEQQGLYGGIIIDPITPFFLTLITKILSWFCRIGVTLLQAEFTII
nr:multicopper oxidase domain-containing protein [Rickettsiella grylli]